MRWLLPLLICSVLPALEFGGLEFAIPETWWPLASPSAAQLRWSLDGSAEAGTGDISQTWLQKTIAQQRVAMVILPTTADSLEAVDRNLRHDLNEVATSVKIGESRQFTGKNRTWIEVSHSLRFAGQAVHQTTWFTLITSEDEQRCLAVSRSNTAPLNTSEINVIRRILGIAAD